MNESATQSSERPLVLSRTLGRFRIHALDAGGQKLDGGAMFGVVPKPLWERRIPADERNRIPLAMRCLLVETDDALVLIDNGAGNKESDRFHEIYGIENGSVAGRPTRLEDALAELDYEPSDIDVVIDTHLHFDHAGGNTFVDAEGIVRPSFPRARYVARRGELEYARLDNERIRASYLPHNFEPLVEAGRLELMDEDGEVVPGVRVRRTPGHTPHHQSVIVQSDGETACFLADLVPTSAHLPLPWIMGYDVEPLVTLESKRSLYADALREDWLLVFEHDPVVAWGRLDPASKRPALRDDE